MKVGHREGTLEHGRVFPRLTQGTRDFGAMDSLTWARLWSLPARAFVIECADSLPSGITIPLLLCIFPILLGEPAGLECLAV